jgi:hypothetical protein
MQIVMCRQLSPRAYSDVLPLSEALRARIRVFLGQGPTVTDCGLAKRPQSAVAALRRTGVRVLRRFGLSSLCSASVPMVRYGGRPGFPQILLHVGRPGLQLSTQAPCRSGQ